VELLAYPPSPLETLTRQGFSGFGTDRGNVLWMRAQVVDGLCERMRRGIQLTGVSISMGSWNPFIHLQLL
jgi:hypothetical protein